MLRAAFNIATLEVGAPLRDVQIVRAEHEAKGHFFCHWKLESSRPIDSGRVGFGATGLRCGRGADQAI